MAIEDDIMHGEVFGEKPEKPEKEIKIKKRPEAKTMAEATSGLKSLDAKRKKSKSGTFAKGTHGSGAAKMRAEYKKKRQARSGKKK